MSHYNKLQDIEKRRQMLCAEREVILGKYMLERELRSYWLVKLMDIEDELEELSGQQSNLS